MKKTKILAFVLTVIMVLSTVSVSAFAAYTRPAVSGEIAENDLIFETDFEGTSKSDLVWSGKAKSIAVTDQSDSTTGNVGKNVFFENGKLVRKTYTSGSNFEDSGDDNNCFDIQFDYTNGQMKGRSYVLSFSIKRENAFKYTVPILREVNEIGALSINIGYLRSNGDITLDRDGEQVVGKLAPDRYTDITIHKKLIAPTDGNSGSCVYDLYVDDIKVVTNIEVISSSKFASAGVTSATCNPKYARVANVLGYVGTNEEVAAGSFSGKALCSMDALRIYASIDTVYETYNSANTVEGCDLTVKGGTLGLNYYLNLPGVVLADENAKVVFTTPRGVQEVAVKGAVAGISDLYKFTANVSSVEMASDITMEIKSGETVYSIYKNGVASDAYTYSVKDYAEKLISDATYGKIAKAMLNYGAYAQAYFKFDTENLANANCGYTTELSAVNNDVSNVSITGDAPAGTKAALVLDSNTSIVIYDKDGNKIGEKKGINSLQLDTEYTIELTGGTNVKVSVLAIGEKVLESDATSQSYKDLIKTLKLFSDASKELNP